MREPRWKWGEERAQERRADVEEGERRELGLRGSRERTRRSRSGESRSKESVLSGQCKRITKLTSVDAIDSMKCAPKHDRSTS